MSAFILKGFDSFKVTTAGTCQVSGVDSEQEEQPFSNLIGANGYAPSKKWCSSFTCNEDHAVSLTCPSGTVTGLFIGGANFSYINYGGYKYLYQDEETGLYSGLITRTEATPVTFTINGQNTDDGYFRMNSIVVLSSTEHELLNTTFPYRRSLTHSVNEASNPSSALFRTKVGQTQKIFEVNGHQLERTEIESLMEWKRTQGLLSPMLFVEDYLSDTANVQRAYLVRRLPDAQYRERSHQDYEFKMMFEEII